MVDGVALKSITFFWQNVRTRMPFLPYSYTKTDVQAISYYAAPKKGPASLDEIDPAILDTYRKLGIPLEEAKVLLGVEGAAESAADARKPVAVDAVFDSVSVKTTFQDELAKAGVIFCSISEAAREHPELLKQYLAALCQ